MSEKIVGYVRVSTPGQAERFGIPVQEESIKRYCKANDFELVHIYKDEGISAYKERPAYQKMLKRLMEPDINGVVVNDLSRFGRSTSDLIVGVKNILDNNKKFISIKEQLDFSSKTGRLMFALLSAIAEFEAETIHERMIAGLEYAKIHGTKSGRPCHRPKIEINWIEVKKWRDMGLSWSTTAKVMGLKSQTLIKRAKNQNFP